MDTSPSLAVPPAAGRDNMAPADLYRCLRHRNYRRPRVSDLPRHVPFNARPVMALPDDVRGKLDLLLPSLLQRSNSQRRAILARFCLAHHVRLTLANVLAYHHWRQQESEALPHLRHLLGGHGQGGSVSSDRATLSPSTLWQMQTHYLQLPRGHIRLDRLLRLIMDAPEPYQTQLRHFWSHSRNYPDTLEARPALRPALEWLRQALDPLIDNR